MHPAPTLDTPLISGIRQVFVYGATVAITSVTRIAFTIVPARSVLRSIYFAADTTLSESRFVVLRLAFGRTNAPVAEDFVGTDLIIPNASEVLTDQPYSADPAVAARDIPYNFQLPDRAGQLLCEFLNSLGTVTDLRLRLVVDGLGRIGHDNGRG